MSDEPGDKEAADWPRILISVLRGQICMRNRMIMMLATAFVMGFFLAPVFFESQHGPWIIVGGGAVTAFACAIALQRLWP